MHPVGRLKVSVGVPVHEEFNGNVLTTTVLVLGSQVSCFALFLVGRHTSRVAPTTTPVLVASLHVLPTYDLVCKKLYCVAVLGSAVDSALGSVGVGTRVGRLTGSLVGSKMDSTVGRGVGTVDGSNEGSSLGLIMGTALGSCDGAASTFAPLTTNRPPHGWFV